MYSINFSASQNTVQQPSPIGSVETKQNDAPFNLEWLAEHFNLDLTTVKKAEFDDFGLMFEIDFHPDKELVAKQFYDNLTKKECYPTYFEHNNSVCLNKYQKEKILFAGTNPFPSNTEDKKESVPESRYKSYAEQQKMVTDLAEKSLISYEIPGTLESFACILSHYFSSNIRLFSEDQLTYTRCKEKVKSYQIMVGQFNSTGLLVRNSLEDIHVGVGVAALRKI